LNDSLEKAKANFSSTGKSLSDMGITWQGVGYILGIVIGTIVAIVTGVISIIINLVMVLVEIIVRIVGHVIEFVSNFISGAVELFSGLWDIIVGIFTDNPTKILTGLLKFGEGASRIVQSAWKLIVQITGDLIEGLVDLVIRLLTDLIAWILRLFGQDDTADKIQEWGTKAIEKVREWLDTWYGKLDEFKNKLHEWVNSVIEWLNKIPGVDIKMNADLNTNTTTTSSSSGTGMPPPGQGSVYQGHASGGVTLPGKPHLAWVGEGKEQEAIIPLSKLPGLMSQMFGNSQGAATGGIILNINNPVVREEQDIDKIADAVSRKIGKRTANSSRLA
jgi:hypothetical protein